MGLLHEVELSQTPQPEPVKVLDLLNGILGIHIEKANRNDLRGIALGGISDDVTVLVGRKHAGRQMNSPAELQQVFDEIRILFVKVDMAVNNSCRLVGMRCYRLGKYPAKGRG